MRVLQVTLICPPNWEVSSLIVPLLLLINIMMMKIAGQGLLYVCPTPQIDMLKL